MLTIDGRDIIPMRSLLVLSPLNQPRDLQHRHHAIQQPMNDLEPRALIAPHRREPPRIARLALRARVLEHDVGRLEDPDRQRVRAVLPDRLEEAGEERGADYLVLERLGVGESDGRGAVVFSVEPGEVLVVRALSIASEAGVNT